MEFFFIWILVVVLVACANGRGRYLRVFYIQFVL